MTPTDRLATTYPGTWEPVGTSAAMHRRDDGWTLYAYADHWSATRSDVGGISLAASGDGAPTPETVARKIGTALDWARAL